MKNDKKSLAVLAGAMFIFGSIGIFRRFIPLSSGLLAFTRGILGAAVLFLFVLIKGSSAGSEGSIKTRFASIGKKNVIWFCIVGALIGINWMLLFEAYNHTSVSVATLCYYMEPTIVILLSPIFFGEKLTAKKLICAAAAIFGMILVSGVLEGGAGQNQGYTGVLLGLGAAALYSSVVIMNKKAGETDPYVMTIIELFAAAVIMLPYLALTEDFSAVRMTGKTLALLFIVGIVHTGMAYAMYFGSMDKLRAQTIALFSYIDPVTALILSAVILHEHMSVYGMAGAVLILGAAAISEYEGSTK